MVQVGFNVWVGKIPFVINFRISKISLELLTGSTRNVNLILRLFIGVSSLFVGQYDFSTIIYWQVRIFTCPSCFMKKGQDKFRSTFQKYYLFHPFFVCRRFLFY